MEVSTENWNYSYFKNNDLKAFICMCAEPVENTTEVALKYAITVTDSDENEIFQQNYIDLNSAVENINTRYKGWEFFNLSQRSDKGGCGSCSAH